MTLPVLRLCCATREGVLFPYPGSFDTCVRHKPVAMEWELTSGMKKTQNLVEVE